MAYSLLGLRDQTCRGGDSVSPGVKAPDNLQWIFDPAPPSGARQGGLATAQIIKPDIDNFVREVVQNARDQRTGDEIVTVRFSFFRFSGDRKERVLSAMGWPALKPHIHGAASGGGVTIGPQLATGLEAIRDDHLTMLRIDDSGTHGLTGGEDDEHGNFNALCRHVLVTQDNLRFRGGSFGLGKSVLWRFSLISTVLFSSRIAADGGTAFRLFGRAELPYHETEDSEWAGPGWYGQPGRRRGQLRAESAWDERAETIARQLHLFRPVQLGTGTSILVVGFFEPQREEPRDLREVAADVLASATRWFWPSMEPDRPTMRAVVEVYENGSAVYRQDSQITSEVKPFVDARWAPQPKTRVSAPGEVAERMISFKVPALKNRGRQQQRDLDATFCFRLRHASADDSPDRRNTVALMRGAGMVVQYRPARSTLSEQPYHAVLFGGLALGNSEADQALELFLRAAEPPSHNEWTPGTDRLRAEYQPGAQARLAQLWRDIDRAVLDLCEDEPQESFQGPRKLAELLPLSGKGGGGNGREKFRIDQLSGQFENGVWHVGGRVRYMPRDDSPWEFNVTVWLDAETGHGEQLALVDLRADSGATRRDGNRWECRVPGGIHEVTFAGSTEADPGNLGVDLGKARIRLEVRARAVKPR